MVNNKGSARKMNAHVEIIWAAREMKATVFKKKIIKCN